MARIRAIKPGFFTSEDVSELPLRARLTWIGLWTHCDDHGRAKDNIKLIKAALWALDEVSLKEVEEDLVVLEEHGRIVRYEGPGGGKFLAVTNWYRHQKVPKATASVLPPPPSGTNPVPLPEEFGSAPVGLPNAYREEGKGEEGNGREGTRARSARPDPWCTRHPGGTETPCAPCGTARRSHDAWKPSATTYPTVSELRASGAIRT